MDRIDNGGTNDVLVDCGDAASNKEGNKRLAAASNRCESPPNVPLLDVNEAVSGGVGAVAVEADNCELILLLDDLKSMGD